MPNCGPRGQKHVAHVRRLTPSLDVERFSKHVEEEEEEEEAEEEEEEGIEH